jgi:FAD/FMN-containing dehydrogenase
LEIGDAAVDDGLRARDADDSRLVRLPALTTVLVGTSLALIFFWVPTDPDQGFSQRIFYLHVPIALTSYACVGWGAWKGAAPALDGRGAQRPRELRRDPPGRDLRRAHTGGRIALGEGVVGRVVDVVRVSLRHTFATFALRAGISTFDLSRYMGASLTMIDRHYGHLARDGREHAIKLLDALNAPEFDPWTLVDARWTPKQPVGVTTEKRKRCLSREKAEAL